ncbi:MAG: NrfD/PsrC family molybdoenzyme membrane anchor subunit [Vicinamibacterales bacterium]
MSNVTTATQPWVQEKLLLGLTPRAYVRSLFTPGSVVAALILAVGLPLIVIRFAYGLGSVTHLSQSNPWGLWVGLDVLAGVALAAGGFTLATTVHVFGVRAYSSVVRPALLTAFLGYLFVVVGLLVDLGRPWKLPVPIVYSFGTSSVMFEVSWCVALYTCVLAMECLPAMFEWLDWPRARSWAVRLLLPATVAGVLLSTLHQSSLGALFLMAPTKLHPLWYSPFIPVFFFVSAIIAGLTMVIVESGISHRVFTQHVDPQQHVDLERIHVGLARAASIVLFCYFFLRLQGLADGARWPLLSTGWGAWYLVELVGFTLLPCVILAYAARHGLVSVIRWTAGFTVVGVVLGRLNVSVIAMNWTSSHPYVPSWMEWWISMTVITIGVLVFRWIVNRMPILFQHPKYPDLH